MKIKYCNVLRYVGSVCIHSLRIADKIYCKRHLTENSSTDSCYCWGKGADLTLLKIPPLVTKT